LPEPTPAFDSTQPYRLNAQIGLRPEPFGALAYHFVTRRLVFLKSPDLVALVERLGDYSSVDAAIAEHITEEKHGSYRTALASLHEADVITTETDSAEIDSAAETDSAEGHAA